jgi:hypothetical protein
MSSSFLGSFNSKNKIKIILLWQKDAVNTLLHYTVAERTITIPLTKNAQPVQKITSAQATLAEDLASVTTGADTYTGTVTWDTAKENGTLTLTAVGNAEFEGTTVTVTNAAALGYTVGTPTVTAETVTVSLTKNVQPVQKITAHRRHSLRILHQLPQERILTQVL